MLARHNGSNDVLMLTDRDKIQSLNRERLDVGLSGSTVQKVHHVLHKALAQAVRWNLIPRR